MKYSDEYLEHALEVLHNCLTPEGFEQAEEEFQTLQELGERQQEIAAAKQIFEEMKRRFNSQSDPFAKGYIKCLTVLRDALLHL